MEVQARGHSQGGLALERSVPIAVRYRVAGPLNGRTLRGFRRSPAAGHTRN
jgi:hypothetical protein